MQYGHVVPEHMREVRSRDGSNGSKRPESAVKDRLTKEITYWDHRAEDLKVQEQAGRVNAHLNSGEARKRADALEGRLQKRMEELKLERQISALPPVVLGGFLVVPVGLLAAVSGKPSSMMRSTVDNLVVAAKARAIVMEIERRLGFEPVDRENDKLGYDIESLIKNEGRLRFLEVKGRAAGADTVTVTKNEILYSLNKPEDFILAIVEFHPDGSHQTHYIRKPFQREPDFAVTSVNYTLHECVSEIGASFMIRYRGLIRSSVRRIAAAADMTVEDLRRDLVEQEPQVTDRLLGRISRALEGYKLKGVTWRAKTLTDRGPGAQERRYGADFVGVLDIDLPDYKVKKGFLAQAKLTSGGFMGRHEFDRMVSQCGQMLELSPSSFIFHESPNGIRAIPAVAVVGASGPDVVFDMNGVYSRKISRFYEEHFECFIGDHRINEPSERTLAALRARSLLYLAARAE